MLSGFFYHQPKEEMLLITYLKIHKMLILDVSGKYSECKGGHYCLITADVYGNCFTVCKCIYLFIVL